MSLILQSDFAGPFKIYNFCLEISSEQYWLNVLEHWRPELTRRQGMIRNAHFIQIPVLHD
jgi:hypothetical protein